MSVKPRMREMALIMLWGVVCWLFFQFFYSYHFFYKSKTNCSCSHTTISPPISENPDGPPAWWETFLPNSITTAMPEP